MKIIQAVVVILLVGSIIGCAFAQSNIKPLQIGDQVPDLEFTNLLNTDKKIIKLSDYRGKLIILDFFATWCMPCIRALPHLDSLQKEFVDELVVIPITIERDTTVMKFLEKHPDLKMSLPYIFNTYLREYFPHTLVPHEVWIDGSGKIVGITGGEEVTAENVRKVLVADNATFKQKRDVVDRDETKPFMAGFFGSYKFKPDQLLFNSIITSGFEGMPGMSRSGPSTKDGMTTFSVSNNYITKLYWSALLDVTGPFAPKGQQINSEFYEKKEFYKQMLSRVIWEAQDSSLLWSKATKEIISKRPYKDVVFNYELRMPATDNATFRKIMLTDLNRYFGMVHGIEGGLEKRKVKCYALTVTGPEKLFKSKGGIPLSDLEKGVKKFKISNYRIDDVMFFWLTFHIPYFEYPIINETNFNGPVDFDLGDIDPGDFHAVNNALKKFGLEFKLVERELDMIVFHDVKE